MADEFDNLGDEYSFDDEVSLDVDEKNAGGVKQEWLKVRKGQIIRGAFIYFHTHDVNAVMAANKVARRSGKNLTREEKVEVAKKALGKRAEELKKSIDQLTPIEKLDISTAHFKSMRAHYQDGLGYILSRLGKDGPEADAIWKRLPDPKAYFSTLFLIYPTNSEGAVNKEELTSQVREKKLKIIPWRFGSNTYEAIWKLNDGLRENNLTLAGQDVKLECVKDEKYQNISMGSAGPVIWQKNPTFKELVLLTAINMYDKLSPFREVTTSQLKEKLGLGGSAVQDVSSDNYTDMLEQV